MHQVSYSTNISEIFVSRLGAGFGFVALPGSLYEMET